MCVCVFVFVTLAYAILCTRCFVVHWSDWLTRDLVILVVIQNGVKIFRFVGFKNKGKNYSVQVFKTKQDVHGWIGALDIVFAKCYCGIFVSARVVFYISFHLLIDRGFKVFQVSASKCSNCMLYYFLDTI